jgi:hypothetical protein
MNCFHNNNIRFIQDILKYDYKINYQTLNNLYLDGIEEFKSDNRNLNSLMKIVLSKFLDRTFNPSESILNIWESIDYLDKIPKCLPFFGY